ncbi:serine/threonine kinase [Ordospora colligata]|uniref:Serine/threonine kinase n=1 Tax=Ordospora colligata OC4 TaxID=1354746 RepID=A0A0B2UJ69_9MICR|nr:serine/threonine kinase [Ordospora colligata OC4]KHN69388.1 serine/threonine kinase [Ordospora colligata OC4]TBU14902.1 serine/threonine kinase [Ordospora colligata]TBU15033.1 serine/threonine kinase [Ordospora colligata]TBU18287.1 serine/threonine kinase [Ordospora colligata]
MATLSQRKLAESIKLLEREWIKMHRTSIQLRCGEKKEMSYRYVDVTGKGSFGVVVKIADDNNNFFALKRVYQDRRYHNRELSILMDMEHPNIISLVSYFYTDKSPSGMYLNIITDFVDMNLEEYISSAKCLDIKSIGSIYKQILEGLRYLHGKSICHRDIKPSNILIGHDGLVKICDLGSAKMIKSGENNVTYICSRFYRAPENLLDYKEYDFKMDVWSVGCVMAEFRHPEPIFKGDTSRSTLKKILEIVKANEEELIELGCQDIMLNPKGCIGIKRYLEDYFDDPGILDVFERTFVFSPHRRSSADELLKRKFFEAV